MKMTFFGGRTGTYTVSLFSKHLHHLNCNDLAMMAAELGFDGIDLTVRRGGHVEPERVEEELPKAVRTIKKAGLKVDIITTDINVADDPCTERVLRTASALGISQYRLSAIFYDSKLSIHENLQKISRQLGKLAELNEKYKIVGEVQNHSLDADLGIEFGYYFGSTIWDLYSVLKNIDSPWLGSQYDIGHATAECTRSWPIGLELLMPFIKSLHVKDFIWTKQQGKWELDMVPIGQGMVDFPRFFEILRQQNLIAPIRFYYGYQITDAKGAMDVEVMKQGLTSLRKFFKNPTVETYEGWPYGYC